MKILYVSGTYCPATGGAELSAHTLLKESQKKGIEVLVLTDEEKANKLENSKYEGINIEGCSHENRENNLHKTIKRYSPNVIITQLMWSDVALKIARENHVPSILRVCKVPFYTDIGNESKYSPTAIMSVSDFVGDYIKRGWNREVEIIPPAIDLNYAKIEHDSHQLLTKPKDIIMFNPNQRKGGHVFLEIAKQLPGNSFKYVPGWDILADTDPEKSKKSLERMRESLGIENTGVAIEGPNFRNAPNVKALNPTRFVREIYQQARIVLIPSQWQETFCRVAIESMSNGIPTIGSDVGGLGSIVREGGIAISDFGNVDPWVEAIRRLDDFEEYIMISNKGKKYVEEKYDLNQVCDKFVNLILKVANV